MKTPCRVLLFPCLLVIPLAVAGCGQAESTLAQLRENEVVRNAARAVLLGNTYDRAAIARRNGDSQALMAAAIELEKLDPLAAAEHLVENAVQLDSRAMLARDPAAKKELEAEAAQKYREALRINPDFPSQNAQLLNALGYFLADRGTSKSDFVAAEKLTRAALKRWDELVEEMSELPLFSAPGEAARFSRAHGPQDSLAWALFKQGRFAEARKEQAAAIKAVEAAAPQIQGRISADLYYHLAEIERGLKNYAAAQKNYQAALKLEPDHEPSLRGLASLTPAKQPAVPEKAPVPEGDVPDPLESGALSADNGVRRNAAPA